MTSDVVNITVYNYYFFIKIEEEKLLLINVTIMIILQIPHMKFELHSSILFKSECQVSNKVP